VSGLMAGFDRRAHRPVSGPKRLVPSLRARGSASPLQPAAPETPRHLLMHPLSYRHGHLAAHDESLGLRGTRERVGLGACRLPGNDRGSGRRSDSCRSRLLLRRRRARACATRRLCLLRIGRPANSSGFRFRPKPRATCRSAARLLRSRTGSDLRAGTGAPRDCYRTVSVTVGRDWPGRRQRRPLCATGRRRLGSTQGPLLLRRASSRTRRRSDACGRPRKRTDVVPRLTAAALHLRTSWASADRPTLLRFVRSEHVVARRPDYRNARRSSTLGFAGELGALLQNQHRWP
jgi:hypothetical protein